MWVLVCSAFCVSHHLINIYKSKSATNIAVVVVGVVQVCVYVRVCVCVCVLMWKEMLMSNAYMKYRKFEFNYDVEKHILDTILLCFCTSQTNR